LGVILATGLGASAQPASQATAFVKQTGDQLVAIVNGPGTSEEKRPRLQKVIDNAVDVDDVARFCLGGFWRRATPDQQRQYMDLFHDVLLNNISGKLGDYKGVHFVMNRSSARGDTEIVNTTVERPNNPPTQVDWIISEASGNPKIVDVVAEGTSLRLTQRSDYASYLHQNNGSVAALIEAMRHQVANAGSG
jgi:phospholipid transport system substrate-binding protein